jgi:hypothetical protein
MGMDVLPAAGSEEPQKPNLGWEALEGSKLKADPNFVDALMHAYIFNEWATSDQNRDVGGYPRTQREGALIRTPRTFHPPKKLSPKDRSTLQTRRFWNELAGQILSRAQHALINDNAQWAQLKASHENREQGPILKVYPAYSVGESRQHIYFHIDGVINGKPPLENAETLKKAVDDFRGKIRKKIEGILENGETMAEIGRIIEFSEKVDSLITFKQVIERLEYIRTQTEDPEQTKRFLDLMQQAANLVLPEGADVTIEILPVEAALMHGAKGLYRPGKLKEKYPENPNAFGGDDDKLITSEDIRETIESVGALTEGSRVYLPFSHYGSSDLVDIEEAYETLAHELAHHMLLEYQASGFNSDSASYAMIDLNVPFEEILKGREQFDNYYIGEMGSNEDVHGLVHSCVTQMVLKKLRKLEFTILPPNSEGNSTDQPQLVLTKPMPREAQMGLDELFDQNAELQEYIRTTVAAEVKSKLNQPKAPQTPEKFEPPAPEKSLLEIIRERFARMFDQ